MFYYLCIYLSKLVSSACCMNVQCSRNMYFTKTTFREIAGYISKWSKSYVDWLASSQWLYIYHWQGEIILFCLDSSYLMHTKNFSEKLFLLIIVISSVSFSELPSRYWQNGWWWIC